MRLFCMTRGGIQWSRIKQSIERHIFKRKERKSNLFNSLISETGSSALTLTKDDLERLFA
jgi:SNF2 family DNA or RNA helicase